MISFAPIWAIVLRHMRMWKRDLNYLLSGFYWPLLDVLIWGFLGSWIQQSQTTQLPNYEAAALLGILLWQVVGRGCNIIGFALSEELWSNNIVNIFSMPLAITEWMIGVVLFYSIMMSITTIFCMFVIFMLYDVSIWYLLSTFMIFLPPLFFCGIWLGFTCMQVVITLGKRGTELGFVVGWFLMPFSGAYYPIEVLPRWGQMISSFLPMSYVFQGMRGYVMHQKDPTSYLIKGYALGILYAIGAIILFVYCFNRSKEKGLARLAD
ncbi:MAG TPA: ABC transporter permease [Candidatus Babeliales bacterium]|nr:ABC transporter permease [Candidatus Babeliales bacterium]